MVFFEICKRFSKKYLDQEVVLIFFKISNLFTRKRHEILYCVSIQLLLC